MRSLIILISLASIAFADVSQSLPDADDPAANAPIGLPSFTDSSRYNSYDFYGSPLGLFEKENSHVKIDMGYRYSNWRQESPDDSVKQTCSAWNAPRILVGSPKAVYMQLFYAPAVMTDNSLSSRSISLNMKRFGFTIAGQVPSGLFQLAFRGNGYVGNETLDLSPNTRLLLGLDAITVSVGSRINDMIAIGIEGGARAKLDTLRNNSDLSLHDRYFDGQLPVIGGFVDFKKNGVPVASAFSITTGTSRFIYVTRNDIDQDPVKGDSLAWKWQSIGNITNADNVYHPALFLGYWQNNYQAYAPTATNDNLNVGDPRPGHDWKIADFCFGIGSSMELAKYATAWLEYSYSSLGLVYGNAWPTLADKNEGYDRFSLGLETALHAFPALNFPSSIETSARIGFFNQRENSGVNAFQSEDFGLINTVAPDSRTNRYVPDFGVWGPDQRIIGTTLGLDATFLNKKISADASLTFLSKESGRKSSGIEFGFDCGYRFK